MFKRRYQPQPAKPRTRINEWIRISPIRLIDEQGNNVGIIETTKALQMARAKGLDLIEIAPQAQPPVCRIMGFGKYQYQKSVQEKKQKSKQKKVEVKGIRISLNTGQHDLDVKVKKTVQFLNKDNKVRIEMILRGREKALWDLASKKIQEFIALIPTEIKIEQAIKREPRGLSAIIDKTR